jgi:hypothetical protein
VSLGLRSNLIRADGREETNEAGKEGKAGKQVGIKIFLTISIYILLLLLLLLLLLSAIIWRVLKRQTNQH